VRLQAVDARRLLKIAYVCILPIVPIVTSGAFHRPLATRGPVKVITDVVSLEFGSTALRRRAAASRRAAAPAARAAASRRLSVPVLLPAAVVKSPA
jgi:hypothetical protein